MKRNRKNGQRGAAIIELALMLPLLLLLSVITTDIGRAVYHYHTITKSVRDAVRYLSVQTPNSEPGITEARNLVVYGNPDGAGAPLVPGLTLANVAPPVWQPQGTNPVINAVTITVSGYTFQSMFESVFGVTFGDLTYNDISASMRAPS